MSCCLYGDGPQVFSEEWPIARKEYGCCECGSKIKRGESYQRIRGKWEDYWDTFITCEKCADLRDSLSEVGCPEYGGLAEDYEGWLIHGPHQVMSVKPKSHAAKLVPLYFIDNGESESKSQERMRTSEGL